MKYGIFAVAVWGLLLSTVAVLPSQNGSAPASPVVLAWQIRVDDSTAFDFNSLKVDIQYRAGKYYAWNEIQLITPDRDGRFVTTLPSGNWVSIHVTTDDPTIAWETGQPKHPDSYTMREGVSPTVFREEIYVEPGPPRTVQKVLQLHRGAAFTLCIPPTMNSGLIRFYPHSRTDKGVDFLSFSDPQGLKGAKVGGLMPSRLIVEFVNEGGVVVLLQELDLRRGELLNPECRSGFISGGPQ
jgi:hypothetical protein